MGMTDQIFRRAEAPVSDDLEEVAAILRRTREGQLSEDAAFGAIGRVVRRRQPDPSELYQKPLG